jgi:hypothetical protein
VLAAAAPAASPKGLVGTSEAVSASAATATPLGEVVFTLPAGTAIPDGGAQVTVSVAVTKETGILVDVSLSATGASLASLKIPSA